MQSIKSTSYEKSNKADEIIIKNLGNLIDEAISFLKGQRMLLLKPKSFQKNGGFNKKKYIEGVERISQYIEDNQLWSNGALFGKCLIVFSDLNLTVNILDTYSWNYKLKDDVAFPDESTRKKFIETLDALIKKFERAKQTCVE